MLDKETVAGKTFSTIQKPQLYWKNSGTVAIFYDKNLLTKRAKEQRKTLQVFRADKDTKDITKTNNTKTRSKMQQ